MGRMQENPPEIRLAQADKVAELLIDVEASLRQMNLWQEETPT